MPLYYFNLRSAEHVSKDPAAAEFLNIEQARRSAVSTARELLSVRKIHDETMMDHTFEICDERGQIVAKVPFREALPSGD